MSSLGHGVLAVVAVLAAAVAPLAAVPSRPSASVAADRPPSSTVPEAAAPPLFRMVASVAVADVTCSRAADGDRPAAEDLAAVLARLRLGVDPATVWRDLARHPQLGGLGRALARAVESGASVADAMQRLSGDLRRTARSDVESRARAVGVKAAVPLGVCLLPAFVLVGVVPLVAGAVGVLAGR